MTSWGQPSSCHAPRYTFKRPLKNTYCPTTTCYHSERKLLYSLKKEVSRGRCKMSSSIRGYKKYIETLSMCAEKRTCQIKELTLGMGRGKLMKEQGFLIAVQRICFVFIKCHSFFGSSIKNQRCSCWYPQRITVWPRHISDNGPRPAVELPYPWRCSFWQMTSKWSHMRVHKLQTMNRWHVPPRPKPARYVISNR